MKNRNFNATPKEFKFFLFNSQAYYHIIFFINLIELLSLIKYLWLANWLLILLIKYLMIKMMTMIELRFKPYVLPTYFLKLLIY